MQNRKNIVDNPLFMKWVFNSNDEVDYYWNTYIHENPEEEEYLNELKKYLLDIKPHNAKLSATEKHQLKAKIYNDLLIEKKINQRKNAYITLFKYAAVAILFAGVGSLLTLIIGNEAELDKYTDNIVISSQISEPTLIRPDDKNIILDKNNSTVDYSNTGEIVLNKDSVVKTNTNKLKPELNQLVIPYGSQSKLTLSDGTTVWLNAGSRLVYPSVFVEKTREVLLFGEAFFDVKKNEKVPFIVKTSDVDIKVLGTQFNVNAYPESQIIQTVLKEGSVAIRRKGAQFFDKDIILEPNQMGTFNKETGQSKIYNVNTEYYTYWIQGMLSFKDVDLNRIIKKLERYYNIKVIYENPILGTTKISGKLDLTQKPEEVFEYLSKVSLTNIHKTENNIYKIK